MSKKKKPTERKTETKQATVTKPEKCDPNTVYFKDTGEGNKGRVIAQTLLCPSVQAAATIKALNGSKDDLSVNNLMDELTGQMEAVRGGDLKRAESMLIAQAHTLDALFGEFARRAKKAEDMSQLKDYMNLGLKAQRQCCMTLEALAEIKNPRPYIQNNRAEYQQVNNGALHPAEGNNQSSTRTRAHTGEKLKSTNRILEDKRHEQQWLDTGEAETAGGNDKEVEAVGEKHRAKD